MGKRSFGELELSILQIVSRLGYATVRDVHEQLGTSNCYTSVMTVMSRLAEKGELGRKKEGKAYVYWLSPRKTPSSNTLLKRIRDKIFGGKPMAMISYLLDTDETLSEQEWEEIDKLIQKRKAEKRENG